jgi:hypothetical protein
MDDAPDWKAAAGVNAAEPKPNVGYPHDARCTVYGALCTV